MERRHRAAALPELWVLSALSATLHFWHLFSPRAVVFDELWYEKFVGYYLTGAHFFDVHPPLGRLMFLGFASVLHLRPGDLLTPVAEPALRLLPALFGTILIPLVFVILRQLGASRRVATIAAIAVLLDNALLVMSRIILPDIFLIVFGLGAVSAYLAARVRAGTSRWGFLILSALLAGCALSVKWTGASGLGVVLAVWFVDWLVGGKSWPRFVREGALLVAIPALVYVGSWAVHFSLITHSGPGDSFMPGRFRAQLPGAPNYDPAAPRLSFWTKLAEVHRSIRYGNASLAIAANAGSSRWYTWPIMKHPVGMWQRDSTQTPTSPHTMIILIGNPVVWWAALIGALAAVIAARAQRQQFRTRKFGLLLLAGGFLLNYVPFIAITRLMYLYHYLFALVYLIAFTSFASGTFAPWMDDDGPPWRFPSRRSAWCYGGIIVAMAAAFLYYAPFTYGWTMSAAAYDRHFWLLHPTF